MKYKKTLFLFYLIASILSAQNMLDSVIITSSTGGYRNPKEKHTFMYNSSGRMTTWLTQNAYGSQQNVSLLTYEYNSNDTIISRLHQKWDAGQLINVSRETYTYDSLAIKLTEHWDGNNWVNHRRERKVKSYLTVGENWSFILNEWVKSWRNEELIEHIGDPPVSTLEYWIQDEWVEATRTTRTYDYKDNIVFDKKERIAESEYLPWMTYEYSISNNNDTTFALAYEWVSSTSEYKRYKRQTCVSLGYNYVQNYISYCFNETYNKFNDSWEDGLGDIKFTDSNGNLFSFYAYRADFYYSTTTDVADASIEISDYVLSQNYPNPFNPSTTINYFISQSGYVQLSVYDMLGQEVANLVSEEQSVGYHNVIFNASSLTSGVYFYKIQTDNFVDTKKMILMR